MGDFIKELTVIDILGILFPGAAFLLLINYSVTEQMTGLTFTASDTVLLLAGGYLLGSLVHEAGDLLEKFLWQFPGFDPKVYAARNVNLETVQAKNSLEEVVNNQFGRKSTLECSMKEGQVFFHGFILGGLLYLILPVFEICWNYGLCWSTLWGAVSLFFNEWGQKSIRKNNEEQDKKNRDNKPSESSSQDNKESQNMKSDPSRSLFCYSWIQLANPIIQTRIVNRENYNKRVLFDGFHAMMRNLCLMVALLNLYGRGAGIDPILLTFIGSYTKLSEWSCTVVAAALILLMMVRYAHYSYLKYKYSYENFINWCEEREKASTAPNSSQPIEETSGVGT